MILLWLRVYMWGVMLLLLLLLLPLLLLLLLYGVDVVDELFEQIVSYVVRGPLRNACTLQHVTEVHHDERGGRDTHDTGRTPGEQATQKNDETEQGPWP